MMDNTYPAPHTAVAGVRIFRSSAHPGTASWRLVYARSVVRPLAACLLPIMIATLVAILQGYYVIPFLAWSLPAAVIIATAWTRYQIERSIAEIRVGYDVALVRTVADVSRGRPQTSWQRVLDLRDYRTWLFATIGLDTYMLDRSDWSAYDELRDALRAAAQPA